MFSGIQRHKLFVLFQRVSKKIFNIIMLFALILPNFAGVMTAKAAPETEYTTSQTHLSQEKSNYKAPLFKHPIPRNNSSTKTENQANAPMTFECVSPEHCESGDGWLHITFNGNSANNVEFFAYPSQDDITLYMDYEMEMHAYSSWADVVGVYASFQPELQGIGSATLIWGEAVDSGYIRGRESTSIYGSGIYSYSGPATGGTPGSGYNWSWDFKPHVGTCGGGYCTYTFIADVYIFIEGFDPRESTNLLDDSSTENQCSQQECSQNAQSSTNEFIAGPINTRTGNVYYQTDDISVSTTSYSLLFQRTYSQNSKNVFITPLGHGWTHSFDTRLIFPDDPGGIPDSVAFKAHSANRYRFINNGDDTYTAAPGVVGTLTKQSNSYTLLLPTQESYTFDLSGEITFWESAEGHTRSYTYNASEQLTEVRDDTSGRFLSFEYDTQGYLSTVTDHTGRQVSYTHDGNGDLVAVTDLAGGTWQYNYDASHRLTEVIDPDGNTVERNEYDAEGRAVRQYDGNDNLVVELIYNADGTTTVIDSLGYTSTHTYDARNTLVDNANPLGASTSKTYDYNFRPATITDENENVTELTWSEDGSNLTNIVDATGNETSITYDPLNNPTSVTDALGRLTTYEYEGTLLTSTEDALGGETTYTYTPEGYLESVTDPLGHTTSYTYDEFGQRTSMTNPSGATWQYSYDDLGQLTDTTDPLGYVSHNDYDNAGRLIRTIQNYDPYCEGECEAYNLITQYAYDARGNQTSVTDPMGHTTTYTYDANGRLLTTTDPEGNQTSNTYDEAGQLIATTDALGRATTYEYDEAGRITSTTDPLENTTYTEYNPDGTVAYTEDALGHATYFEYDELKRVIATEDELGNRTSNVYDEVGNLIESTDKLGNTTTYEYDALGRVILQTNPDGGETETFYDAAGNRVQTIDARGNATTYGYDEANRLLSVTDAVGNVTSYEYDLLGRRTAVVDANENRTEYVYDALGRVATTIDPLGNESEKEYDVLGNLTWQTNPNGEQTSFEYDLFNRLIRQIDPLGGETSYTYDAVGNRLTITDPNNHTTATTYDALNRPVASTNAKGYSSYQEYDEAGNLIYTEDAFGEMTFFAYDELNRQTQVQDPLENVTQYDYDANGNRIAMTDANGVVTRYEYDSMGRLHAVVENYKPGFEADAETNVRTEYTYDLNGNRLTITDGNGHTSNFTYDELNRLRTESDPLGNTWTYGYDAVGNRSYLLDANHHVTVYEYNENNQLTFIDYLDNDIDVSFDYDEAGRRVAMEDFWGTTSWNYDDLGRPTAITDPFGKTVGYSYDAAGNRTGLTYPDGKQVQYAYDPLNLLAEVTDWNEESTTYTYDANGQLDQVSRPNGIISQYDYDPAGRVTQIQHATEGWGELPGETLSSFQYAYDGVGNRVQAIETFAGAGQAGPTVLVTATNSSGIPMIGKALYVFDGTSYTGYHATTDENGQASITLPEGNYRFRLDVDGTQFWSGEENHCQIAGCTDVMMTVPEPVLVNVQDSEGSAMAGISVYAFDGTDYTGYHGVTDENGQLSMRLPEGDYRFRADFNGTQFWSDAENHCTTPGCTIASISITLPVTVTVADHLEMPQAGVNVYAFTGTTYSGYHGVTDENGQVELTLPEGEYRFRADFNGTQFWSSAENDCPVPGCSAAAVTVSQPLMVAVQNTDGEPQAGLNVYAFDGSTYTGYHKTTDENGEAAFTLPEGDYRFRADLNGTQFWSGVENHCAVPDCGSASVTVSIPLTVTVQDTDGGAASGLKVYAFDETTYTGYNKTTDENGQAIFTLPLGAYRFRADLNGTQFWSASTNHCDVPGCESAAVTVSKPVTVLIQNGAGEAEAGVKVYAFDGTSYQGYNKTSDENGEAIFTLPLGSYRFRADFEGEQYWSDAENSCEIPDCESDLVVVGPIPNTPTPSPTAPATATPTPTATQTPAATPTPTSTATPEGNASLGKVRMLPFAPFFRAAPQAEESNVLIQVADTNGAPSAGLNVYAFDGETYTGYHGIADENGQVSLTLPDGDYRFRADLNGTQFWSGEANHCTTPGCTTANITVTIPMVVTVSDPNSESQVGLNVYAFDGETYTGYHGTTDENGEVEFTLPEGDYRFRADLNGTQFWSGEANHCTTPGCTTATITVTIPVNLTVVDTNSEPQVGLNVYAFDGETYTGYHGVTDENGEVEFTLPEGSYRFRSDLNGTQFWSGEANHCTLPGCASATVTVTIPLSVYVDGLEDGQAHGINVYAFDGETYTGYHEVTDEGGSVEFTLPQGSYRFRADLNGTQFWSGEANHCAIPGCEGASVTVTQPLTVTVAGQAGTLYPDLNVYAFDGETYTGYHGVTDENGEVEFTLPEGSYRFRADYDGVQFWSSTENDCTVPGCSATSVTLPGVAGEINTTIDYTYDPLYRLTDAEYASTSVELDGNTYAYSYDAVGNRLSLENSVNGQSSTVSYIYDSANRLASVDGIAYSYDNNGNLLNDGTNNYYYDFANRLGSVVDGESQISYDYNGLGDRVYQNINNEEFINYALDLNAGLTQVLVDGSNTYLYGNGRISQSQITTPQSPEYFLGDALGSVRQLTDLEGEATLTQSYSPYGEAVSSVGDGYSAYQFTGESRDANGLTYLRARYYASQDGRFISRDTWAGLNERPLSLNQWNYVESNPVNLHDPTGLIPCPNNPYDNSCNIYDYVDWYFGPLLSAFGAPRNLSRLKITIDSQEVSFTGAVTKEYMTSVYYYGVVMNNFADIGLGVVPGGGFVWDVYNSSVGRNPFSGYVYSPSERYLISAFALIGGVSELGDVACKVGFRSSAEEVFERAVREGILDPKHKHYFTAFTGDTKLVKLEEDLIVIQRTSPGGTTTPWFTTREYVYAGNARRYLALPNWNDGTQIAGYLIPKDTTIIVGKVASQAGDLRHFGTYAVGGGFQIYLPELSRAIKLP